MPGIIFICFAIFAVWVVRREIKLRDGISAALWIPVLWVAILGTRPVSMWLAGADMAGDSLEGNTTDALGFFIVIASAIFVCLRRNVNWAQLFADNKAIFFFYLYFLISVSWSEHPFSAFKRLFKDFGTIFMVLVILTENNPREAIKSVFVRLGYVLIPLSVIFIRYFPELGRHYNIHSGLMEAVGVTTQKNSLGAIVMVCGLTIIFDLVDRANTSEEKYGSLDLSLRWGTLLMGIYLLRLCDSKTSMVCLVVGGAIMFSSKLPLIAQHLGLMAKALIGSIAAFFVLDSTFHIKAHLLKFLGRDATLTGRTDVWEYLLGLHTDPIIGMGFCTIWDSHFRKDFPYWMADSAHNGYLEVYLDGGWIGVAFLLAMLLVIFSRSARRLEDGDHYSLFRFVIVLVTIIFNISESMFARISPGWTIFLLVALDYGVLELLRTHAPEPHDEQEEDEPIEVETVSSRDASDYSRARPARPSF